MTPPAGDPLRSAGRPFVKMHGLRNHFVIVDARTDPWQPPADEIVRICDVQTGVGADQLIVMDAPRNGAAAVFMRIYNMDGREAEACGNATRCVAWLLLVERSADSVTVETLAGLLQCDRAGEQRVRCEMGRATTDWRRIPLSHEVDTMALPIENGALRHPVAVSVGNPHAVFFVDGIDDVDLRALAPAVQSDPLFPQQVNVGAAEIVDGSHLRLSVYERGAGLTMACGSGACAAVYAARVRGLCDALVVTVSLPGGDVDIEIREDDVAVMTGPVAFSFTGVL